MYVVEVFVKLIPLVVCPVEVVNMSMKSGMSLVWGSKIPRSSAFKLICAMRRA